MPMRPEIYRRKAQRCEQLARLHKHHRDRLLELARRWEDMAREAETSASTAGAAAIKDREPTDH
jgi:hypothetical protein